MAAAPRVTIVTMRMLIALVFATLSTAQTVEYMTVTESVLESRLKLAAPKNPERYARLKALFDETGCRNDAFHEQRVPGSKEPNLICGVQGSGESQRKILVGAHFDSVGGDGVIDNWSGAILLPSLSEFMRMRPRRHTFEFVGFAGEEKGLLGSRAYLRTLTKEQRETIAAVVIMDSLGLTATKCWVHGSSPELVTAAAAVARALKLDFGYVNVERVGTTDSAPFQNAHIPVLSLHSVTQETWRIINGKRDVWTAVSWKDYYDSHKLISALLVYLDRTLP